MQIFEGSLIAPFDGGDIPVEATEYPIVVFGPEGGGHENVGILADIATVAREDFFGVAHQNIVGVRFDPPGSIEPPEGFGELVGEHLFFRGSRAIGGHHLDAERVEVFLCFSSNDQRGGAKAVRETVLAGSCFAGGGTRSSGPHGIDAIEDRATFGLLGGKLRFVVGDTFVDNGFAVKNEWFGGHDSNLQMVEMKKPVGPDGAQRVFLFEFYRANGEYFRGCFS